MKQYYWSYENIERDYLPINLLFEEWDPDEDWIQDRAKREKDRYLAMMNEVQRS